MVDGTPVLVTGALGTVGRVVVEDLLAAGVRVRAADRRAAVPPGGWGGGAVEPVTFDFTDPATWSAAFAGVDRMFLLRPPQLSRVRRDMVPALEAAKRAGVRRMVLLSLQGADRNKAVPHARLEAWLRASGLEWTFVRPSFFMQNLSTTHAVDIRQSGQVVVPAGRGRTAFVDARDVGAVAARVLVEDGHAGRSWTPTGPQALTYGEVAAVLTDVLGRPVEYTDPTPWGYARHARAALDMPWGMVGVTTAIYTAARLGLAGRLTGDVQRLLGRPPRSFRTFAEDHADVWR